ncbi:hypothetical protein SprV_0200687100 [Sparganum proliferum]
MEITTTTATRDHTPYATTPRLTSSTPTNSIVRSTTPVVTASTSLISNTGDNTPDALSTKAPTNTAPTASNVDSIPTCPYCIRVFTSCIGLVGYPRILCRDTGEPVHRVPTYTHLTRLHSPHCLHTFSHHMGLLGHSHVLCYADGGPRDRIDYRTNEHLLNSRQIQAPTRFSATAIHDLLFADDCALNITTEEDMQRDTDLFASGYAHFGLTINMDKTVIVHQKPSTTEYSVPRICVNETELTNAGDFNYPGSTMSRCIQIDGKVTHQISNSNQAFSRLLNSVWNRHGLQMNIKLKIYQAVVLATLLHGEEVWTVDPSYAKKLNSFHLSCLCGTLKLRCQGRICDTEVLERTGILSIHAMLRQLQLR